MQKAVVEIFFQLASKIVEVVRTNFAPIFSDFDNFLGHVPAKTCSPRPFCINKCIASILLDIANIHDVAVDPVQLNEP